MKVLSSNVNEYKVGLTGNFKNKKTPYAVYDLLAKLNQIHLYCKKWNKPVCIYVDERCPAYIFKFMSTQGYRVIPVLKGKDNPTAYNVYTPDIDDYLNSTCDVVVILCEKSNRSDYEFETEKSYVYLDKRIPHSQGKVRKIENPNELVRDFVKKAKQDSDPYSDFSHEPLYEVVPYDHWNQVMDTMDKDDDTQQREFV